MILGRFLKYLFNIFAAVKMSIRVSIPGNSLGTNFCQLHFLRKRRPLQKNIPISWHGTGKDAHWKGKDANWTRKDAHFF